MLLNLDQLLFHGFVIDGAAGVEPDGNARRNNSKSASSGFRGAVVADAANELDKSKISGVFSNIFVAPNVARRKPADRSVVTETYDRGKLA
jgi:hypothetical protein